MTRAMTLALAAVCALGSGAARAADTIKIGLMAPITGQYASEGAEMKRNIDLVAEQLNAKGVNGKKIEIFIEDDGGDARTASLAAQRLTTKGVFAVIGTYGSSVTEASQGIYDEAKILQVANGSTAVRLTEKGLKYFLRTCPRDDEQGRVGAAAILKRGAKKVAILHDSSAYAKGLADEINGLLKGKDAKVVFFDALTPKEQDYSAILTKLKAAGPDVVFFTGYYPEAGLLLKQKKQMGWNVPFIGGDAINNPDLVKIAGKDAAAGFQFLSPPVPRDLQGEVRRGAELHLRHPGRGRVPGGDEGHRRHEGHRRREAPGLPREQAEGLPGPHRQDRLQRQGRPRRRAVPGLQGRRERRV